jgi:hypothetical protein
LVAIDGRSQPIGQDGRAVTVPLHPGLQTIYIEWRQAEELSVLTRSPGVMIGRQAANARVTIEMPPNRWVLWTGGPRLGPAVLFWTYLLVVVWPPGLSRIRPDAPQIPHWFMLGLGQTQSTPCPPS